MASRLKDEFYTEVVTVRDQSYSFRELSGREHDECVKLVADEDGNADLSALLILMTAKASVTPKMTPESLSDKPYPVRRKLLDAVNLMHYGPVEKETGTSDVKEEEPPNED